MGEYGDFGRRFCRMLRNNGVAGVTGVDPTLGLLDSARRRDPLGTYVEAFAEKLPFKSESFDLAISYLSMIDIPDVETAIPEMARVLKPGADCRSPI